MAAQDYESRRARGDLVHITKAREKTFLSQPVPHSFSEDGAVRFGQTIMLATGFGGRSASASGGSGSSAASASASSASTRYLANLIYNFLSPGHARVTAGAEARPQARNTFVLGRTAHARAPGVPEDDCLRYGDRITLACNPSLVADAATRVAGLPLYLHSARGNNVLGTTRKGRQDVSMCKARDADAEWLVVPASGDRLACDGAPVPSGAPIALVHAMSNVMLAASPEDVYLSDFGAELSVHCATAKSTGQLAISPAGQLPVIPAQPCNTWAFVHSASREAGVDTRGIQPLTPAALLLRARGAIAAASGPHGLRSLALAFEALDPRGSGVLPTPATRWALYEHGARLEEAEFALLSAAFVVAGRGGEGGLARGALLEALRGSAGLSPEAAAAVRAAHAHVQATRSSSSSSSEGLTLGDLVAAFDGKLEGRVAAGRMTRAEARSEFSRQWPRHRGKGARVSAEDLQEYYADVVPLLAGGEGALAELLANTWHLPGQGSWQVRKSLRVLVTFHKGSSTEALIKEGEGIPQDDQELLAERLKAMGFGGIARVKVLGLVEPVEE